MEDLVETGNLMPLPNNQEIAVNSSMPSNRRYARAWTVAFLNELGRVHANRFRGPLQINSAARTVEFQRHLIHINGNAAAADGDMASPHLTGAAIDIGKHGLSMSEIGWLRAWLLPLQEAGKIDVEEEFHQACFHITVYRSYSGSVPRRNRQSSTLLAAGVQ